MSELDSLIIDLKNERNKIKADPEDSDIEIMAVYKLKDIDCIFTVNEAHFKDLCTYLGIDVEKPIDDFEIKMKKVFGRK